MKRKIYIPQLAEIEFDFMQMKPESFRMIDGQLKVFFELKAFNNNLSSRNLSLGIYFNYNENAIDEHFTNYRYTELKSLYKIKLLDYNAEYIFSEKVQFKILQIAKAVMPRKYTEITSLNVYLKSLTK
ncbi:Uncharacterised protein [Algoriella xinjiangensis]|uniref:hypothetical protein n=1 Tax=Algoriella xinjiangensis TaxID=684065 RepID=UPI000F63FCCC|nr:hypothetical protein [Algoriella xinjiangensis]VDH16142.1 Uncharacterised protein [Algoriella xinjiangensis]